MVLEEATAQQDASSSEALPSSDADTYASAGAEYREGTEGSYLLVTPKGANPIYVNLSNLPRRFSVFGQREHPKPLLGAIVESCRLASEALNRPIRQEEADAFAAHIAKTMSLASYGTPVGVAIATAQCYRRSNEFRFPGWTPFKEGGRLNPEMFGPLRGSLARSAWQVSRYSAYYIVGSLVGQIFFGSYALSVGTADRARDPRLKDVRDAFRSKMREGGRSGPPLQRAPDESDGPRRDETFEMARQRRSAQGAGSGRGYKTPDDDMSPSGGSFMDDIRREDSAGQDVYDRYNSQPTSGSDDWMKPVVGNSVQSSAQSQRAPNNTSSSSSSNADESAQQQKRSGSAWDRLRQNAISGQNERSAQSTTTPSRSMQTTSSTSTQNSQDSFSFSQGEEDRQLAKAEAQKEFDARVEREREGKNFGDDNRSWRR